MFRKNTIPRILGIVLAVFCTAQFSFTQTTHHQVKIKHAQFFGQPKGKFNSLFSLSLKKDKKRQNCQKSELLIMADNTMEAPTAAGQISGEFCQEDGALVYRELGSINRHLSGSSMTELWLNNKQRLRMDFFSTLANWAYWMMYEKKPGELHITATLKDLYGWTEGNRDDSRLFMATLAFLSGGNDSRSRTYLADDRSHAWIMTGSPTKHDHGTKQVKLVEVAKQADLGPSEKILALSAPINPTGGQ